MTLKIELRIEYHTLVFMLCFDNNFGPTEKHRWVDNWITGLTTGHEMCVRTVMLELKSNVFLIQLNYPEND